MRTTTDPEPGQQPGHRPGHRPGERPGLLGRTGRACYRHRRLTLAAWVAGVACLVVLWMQFGAPADNSFTGNDPGQLTAVFGIGAGLSLIALLGHVFPARRSRRSSPR